MRIQTKLTLVLLSLSFGVIVVAGIFSTITLDAYFRSRVLDELKRHSEEAEYIVRLISPSGDSLYYGRLQTFSRAASVRLTLIARDGRVVFESEREPAELGAMENHAGRPEVMEALAHGSGASSRTSATLGIEMLYFARALAHPFAGSMAEAAILRVGVPLTQVNDLMSAIRSKILVASSVVLAIVVLAAVMLSHRLAAPVKNMERIASEIRGGTYDRQLPVETGDELGKLAETINGMIDRLRADIASLKKLERVRSEFLGNVSHELRTPIFAVQGMLETLLGGAIEDPAVNKEFVRRALHNTERLNVLLADLIEISRIQSGDMKLSFRYFPLQELLRQVLTEMTPVAVQKGISLSLEPSPETDVLGDRERLKQVLINLVGNAISYNVSGGKVVISAHRDDGAVKVTVRDTGVGIAAEHLPRIFERFYRVDKERSREAGGTGLGLAIVKHIVEAHGSRVDVESRVGSGSSFSFILKT